MAKDCARDELLVRARRKGDIEKVFPKAKVKRNPKADYLYRARVKKAAVTEALKGEVDRITYSNLKSSVKENKLHMAYMRVWSALGPLQENWDDWPMFKEF